MSSQASGLPARSNSARTDRETVADSFKERLQGCGEFPLAAGAVTTVQVNLGKRCNQACSHCHVDAGPARTEQMSRPTVERVLQLVERSDSVQTVDLTGGAPELHPDFRLLVERSRRLGKNVIDRCNLTVLLEDGMEGLVDFLAEHEVRVVASLPCYTKENVDEQRGAGVFESSLSGMAMLNDRGYGVAGSGLVLDLVFNPGGASLPGPQDELEQRYHQELGDRFGLRFNQLLTLTNLPVKRFADWLRRRGEYDSYLELLDGAFNPKTVSSLMCRSMVSISWQGELHDCDFNQMLEIPIELDNDDRRGRSAGTSIWQLESFDPLGGRSVTTAGHCFGCTAGAGSSCAGALS
ncbi:MAG: arsenosugar biosynthesis radical SAM protein ArsS [Deltaproteobacteria bacterium]|nr:arsenosugar biosynthesis radical SAM protein ArsS [Deltaproteobacteria bacterium]